MFNALIALAPFLVTTTLSVIWMLRRPKAVEELEDSEMLTGLFEEVITGREKQKRFAEEQEKKLRLVAAKVEGEAERRLSVVQEVEREKKERRENEDNLKYQVSENIRSLESRMISEMASRLAKIPLPKELKKKMGVDGKRGRDKYDSKERALKGDRPDSAASIYDDHQRDERKRRGALDDDVEAQRNAFQRRLGERRGRDGDRERSRGRSKSRPRR
jgi:myosin heavy subunit